MILTVTPNPCVDKTLHLDTLRVGAKNVAPRYGCVAGGKGCNVSRALLRMGYDTAAMAIVGGHTGRHVIDMLSEDDGIRCLPVWVAGSTRTITTVLESSGHRQTPLFEPGSPVTPDEKDALIEAFRDAVNEAEIVTFNGTVPDPVLSDLYRILIPIAQDAGALTILDSHGPEFAEGIAAMPHMVKPNLHEAAELTGLDLSDDAARWRAIDTFHERGIRLVVLSLGPEGALVSDGVSRIRAVPPAIQEINAVGSGDALVAGFAIGLDEGWPLEVTTRLAVAMGTANAMSWDIGHFTREQVEFAARGVRITCA